jgi:hypothetical protein
LGDKNMELTNIYPIIGVCGLDCGLCPRYYTAGTSKCPGCCGPDFFNKHPSCSFITCCVKKKNLEACAECNEFPCSKFDFWKEDGEGVYDSFLTYKKVMPNLDFIKEHGIEEFIEQQKKRNEEPCGKPQGINSHITNTAAATLWQATGNPQVETILINN